MDRIKISSLGIFDEQKFKKLASDRENLINSSSVMIENTKSFVNVVAEEIQSNQNILQISKIDNYEKYKIFHLTSISGKKLPLFRAGQKIAITINIDGCYYTKPYSIASCLSKVQNPEINILVKKDVEDIVSDHLYNRAKVFEKVISSLPFGNLYYDKFTDEKNVIAIANDEGIIPIYAMMQEIRDGVNNYNLTVFYTEKHEQDFILKNELINLNNNGIKVIFVLSEEEQKGCLSGFVSIDKIKKYYVENETSFFIAGNEGLLKYLDKELEAFKLPKRFIKYDDFLPRCNIRKVTKYNLSIYINDEKYDIPCYNNKTIMQSLFEGGIYIPSKCHNGSCGFCRSELVKGEVKIVNDKRVNGDKKYNFIHPCSTYPLSDIEIIVR